MFFRDYLRRLRMTSTYWFSDLDLWVLATCVGFNVTLYQPQVREVALTAGELEAAKQKLEAAKQKLVEPEPGWTIVKGRTRLNAADLAKAEAEAAKTTRTKEYYLKMTIGFCELGSSFGLPLLDDVPTIPIAYNRPPNGGQGNHFQPLVPEAAVENKQLVDFISRKNWLIPPLQLPESSPSP